MFSAKTKESFKEINKSVMDIYNSKESIQGWLKWQLNFRNYSPLNRLYLHNQNPEATYVASYNWWKESGFPVVQSGCLYVMSPMMVKGFYDAQNKWKPLKEATDQEKQLLDTGALKIKNIVRDYKRLPVFDISKTNATEEDLVAKITEKKNKGKILGKYNLDEVYENLSEYLEDSSKNASVEAKIYEVVSNYVDDVLSKDSNDFDTASDTLEGDDLRNMAKEAITFVVLDRFQVDNTLFKYNALTKVHWDEDHIKDLMHINKYICNKSEEVVDILTDALM